MTKNGPIWAKNGKKRTAENFGTTYLDPKSKNNCTLFSSIFQKISPFSRYGRLKLKFLCEQYSHCIYSFCSIELTKTRNTWSLTAVVSTPAMHIAAHKHFPQWLHFRLASLSTAASSLVSLPTSQQWRRIWKMQTYKWNMKIYNVLCGNL